MPRKIDTTKPSLVYTQVSADILRQMQAGASMRTACGLAGVTAPSVCAWLAEGEREPEGRYGAFTRDLRRIQAQQILEAEQQHREARAANPNALQWWLQRMDPVTYGEPVSAANRQPIEVPDATDDEVAEALGK